MTGYNPAGDAPVPGAVTSTRSGLSWADLRATRGISLRELERTTGINRGELSRIEHGRAIPTPDQARRILEATDHVG